MDRTLIVWVFGTLLYCAGFWRGWVARGERQRRPPGPPAMGAA